MKKAILFFSIITATSLVGVTIYNTIIDAKSWGADIPNSIQVARDYYKHVDPRNFFLIFGPINQFLILLVLILFWKDSVQLRIYFATSFVLYALIVILTLAYFIPRDLILFTKPISGNIEQIKVASAEWNNMNWIRSLLGLAGILCSFRAVDHYYKIKK
ncbi:MAG TPA: DUF1772 domain-containing protein [Chitinophagaceae bacterium]|jgi:uncharacterized integral membrane protein